MNEDVGKEQQFLDKESRNAYIIRENYNIEKFFKQVYKKIRKPQADGRRHKVVNTMLLV